jgi:hypothetical protein
LKIDKHVKDLSKKVDSYSNGNGHSNVNEIIIYDDDYYLDRGSRPPRFLAYRHARAEKWKALGHKPQDHVYDTSITLDELDFNLKRELRISPEQRYQRDKANFLFHELSCYMRGLGEEDYGCTGGGCIPECRFYPEYGRIEDEEVIEEHNKFVEKLRQRNDIVEPPSESEMLRLAKIYRFS